MPHSLQKTLQKTFTLLTKPVVLSGMITLAIVFLFLPDVNKYNLKMEEAMHRSNVANLLWDDLDGNGTSDRISTYIYAKESNVVAVQVQMNPAIAFMEWNFIGNFNFHPRTRIMTGDFNHDGMKEVYLFYLRSDSVFLGIIKNPTSKINDPFTRFITTYRPINGSPNVSVTAPLLTDMDLDGFDDLVFAINAGFSTIPRKDFIYRINDDSLISSPMRGFFGGPVVVANINSDPFPEILIDGYAIQNIEDTVSRPLHDRCCWLIAYDHNLNYLFHPVKFTHRGYSGIAWALIPNQDKTPEIVFSYLAPVSSNIGMVMGKIDQKGQILKTCTIPNAHYGESDFFTVSPKSNPRFMVCIHRSEMLTLDTSLRIVDKKTGSEFFQSPNYQADLDDDGEPEIVMLDSDRRLLTVVRSDLSHATSMNLPNEYCNYSDFSVTSDSKSGKRLVLFNGTTEYFISYKLNPYYYYRWGVYFSIFAALYLFAFLIRKLQRDQWENRRLSEKKITELQMQVVRNQMDPHFTMNAINSVIAAINDNEKEQATQHLLHFSKMYRHLVTTADKIQCSLAEELTFTQNYLSMEQFRFREKFAYELNIAPEVDLEWMVPKMVVQSPVENAIKHGLRPLTEGGKLVVRATTRNHFLELMVEDNGIGRKQSARLPEKSTGKGMKAMRQFLELYQKITGVKITTKIEDANPERTDQPGTRVTIMIEIAGVSAR